MNLNIDFDIFNRVSLKDKSFLSRQLATMLSSGLPLDRAVSILATQSKKKILKETLEDINKDLESGQKFSAAISRHPKVFDRVYVNIVVSGEAVGKLSEVMLRLSDQLEKQEGSNGKITSALLYPAFIILAMGGVMILMMTKVVPQLKEIFSESGAQLPWTTRLLVYLSQFLVSYWWLAILIIIGLIIILKVFLMSDFGSYLFNKIQIGFPGDIGKDLYMARFSRTLGMLVQSGTPIIEAVKITAEVLNNKIYRDSLLNVASQLERGIPMSVPIGKDANFPVVVPQMIMVGEQTGRLDQILNNLANYYENQSDDKIKGLTSLFEPALIILIGLAVAFVVFSILGPIYQIVQLQ